MKKNKENNSRTIIEILICVSLCFSLALNLFFVLEKEKKEPIKVENTNEQNKQLEYYQEYKLNELHYQTENYHNAPKKLDLLSSYGDTQAFHPKVLYFENSWNGYKYWLTFSPYPYSDDKKENPHILVSNDMVNWKEPKGFKNPLEEYPKDYRRGKIYYSDPHLVYNNDLDILECYFRRVDDIKDEVVIYKKTTKDGIKWTDKEIAFKDTRSKKDFVSFSIIYDNGIYKMWYIDTDNTMKYAESKDGYKYENTRTIKLSFEKAKLKEWHLDIIKSDLGYEMIVVAFDCWDNRNNMELYYFNSKDNQKWSKGVSILRPSLTSWDNKGIYRSSILKKDGTYYIFYSGTSKKNSKGVGLTYGKNIYNLKGYVK